MALMKNYPLIRLTTSESKRSLFTPQKEDQPDLEYLLMKQYETPGSRSETESN